LIGQVHAQIKMGRLSQSRTHLFLQNRSLMQYKSKDNSPDSKSESYQNLKKSGKLSSWRAKIYLLFKDNPDQIFTQRQIARKLSMSRMAVTQPIWILVQDGFVEKTPEKIWDNQTERNVTGYRFVKGHPNTDQ